MFEIKLDLEYMKRIMISLSFFKAVEMCSESVLKNLVCF